MTTRKKRKPRHPKNKTPALPTQLVCQTHPSVKPCTAATQFNLLWLLPRFIRRKVDHRPGLVKVLDNIGWLFIDKVLRMGVGLLVGVWVARYLGPEQFGQINFAMAFVGLFGAIAGLGLNGIVVRDIVREPESANTTLGTAFVLEVFGSLVAITLIVGSMAWLRPEDTLTKTMVAIFGLGLVFKSTEVVKYWFESQVHSRYTVWVENGVFVIMVGVKVTMILRHAPLLAFVWTSLAESALVAVGLLAMYAKRGGRLSAWHPRIARAKSLLKDSWPLILSGLAVMIYMRIDQIMLGEMLGAKDVGNYAAAVKISEVWYFIPTVIASSTFPSIIEVKKHSKKLYYKRLQKLFNLMVLSSVMIALPMTFFSDWVVRLLYGSNFTQAGGILSINIWAGVFVFLGVASSNWLLAENLQNISFYRTAIGALINIVLNYLLIPQYGGEGAAFATLVSYGFAALFFDLLNKRTRVVFYMKLSAFSFGLV
jgi:O-antigen/teichoic acid export membrane protein